jgi:hypothetical protein
MHHNLHIWNSGFAQYVCYLSRSRDGKGCSASLCYFMIPGTWVDKD